MNHIVYACNQEYVRQTIVSMASLLMHNAGAFTFWVISDGITEEGKTLIAEKTSAWSDQITLRFLELSEVLEGIRFAGKARHPRTIYAKLFLENRIPADRALYLDSDTLITGDIEAIFERDMDRVPELAAGVLMPYSAKVKAQTGISAGASHICDGVVLLNLALWRKEKAGEQCKSYIEACGGEPPMLSEGTLCHVCAGRLGVLEPKYDVMPHMLFYKYTEIKKLFQTDKGYYKESEIDNAAKKPLILHFMKELYNRPWFSPCDHPYKESYYKIELEIFKERLVIQQFLSRHTEMTRLAKNLLPFPLFAGLYHMKNRM